MNPGSTESYNGIEDDSEPPLIAPIPAISTARTLRSPNDDMASVEEAGQRFHRVLDKTQGGLRSLVLDVRSEGASLTLSYRQDQDVPLLITDDREADFVRVMPGGLWN